MTMDRDVTRDLRAWLRMERGEDADRVVNDVLDQIDWIDQRQPSWVARRFPIMNNNRFRLGIAAAVVVAVAFLGLRFLPTNLGGPEPIPETAFVSERHHYMLLFPDDSWLIVERPGDWAEGTVFDESSPGLDFADKIGESEPYILLASQPLDLDPDEWLARYDRLAEVAFPHCPLDTQETRTVDGEEARVSRYACEGPSDGVEAIMFHGDRVHAVRVFDGDDESYDPRPLLDEFLDIFRFLD